MLRWKTAQIGLMNQIEELVRVANQKMLLQNLNETRSCHELLEPSGNEDEWERRAQNDDNDDSLLAASLNYLPGHFACPKVYSEKFVLHPRLLRGGGKRSLGYEALSRALEHFAVMNRANMYVCQDGGEEKEPSNYFYARIGEELSAQAGAKHQTLQHTDEDDLRSRSSSVSSYAPTERTNLLAAKRQTSVMNTPVSRADCLTPHTLRHQVRMLQSRLLNLNVSRESCYFSPMK